MVILRSTLSNVGLNDDQFFIIFVISMVKYATDNKDVIRPIFVNSGSESIQINVMKRIYEPKTLVCNSIQSTELNNMT